MNASTQFQVAEMKLEISELKKKKLRQLFS